MGDGVANQRLEMVYRVGDGVANQELERGRCKPRPPARVADRVLPVTERVDERWLNSEE